MILSWFEDFLQLIYPKTCAACEKSLSHSEELICTDCLINMPQTFYHEQKNNLLFHLFWGKIPLEFIASFYFYNKGNKVQHLIHQLKYRGRPDIAQYVGKRYGQILKEKNCFSTVDLIIPVPLHFKKLKKRGYNQAEKFASGLSESLKIPLDSVSFIRSKPTETQTKKTKEERWKNVFGKFEVVDSETIKNKHLLLVDDVLTTGSTIEACALSLQKVEGVKLSICSMATAHE